MATINGARDSDRRVGGLVLLIGLSALLTSIAFAFRDSNFVLTALMSVAALGYARIAVRLELVESGFVRSTFLASTIYRRADVRVSMSYLYSIRVEGKQLLVRGNRIRTQYQPVGGVFKTDLDEAELLETFEARPDTRFTVDAKSRHDLRLRLPGRRLKPFLRWFKTREDREVFPLREFHEELVKTGILPEELFRTIDSRYKGLRHFPLEYDSFSECRQLIAAEIYELRPSTDQRRALERLLRRSLDGQSSDKRLYFASIDEIRRGGAIDVKHTSFDLARTTRWLL